jgi:hypothetical protein
VNGRADRRLEARRIAGRPRHETRVMKRIHGMRLVDRLPRLQIEAVVPDVADDTCNGQPGSVILLQSDLDSTADGIDRTKPVARERLADEHSGRRVHAIAVGNRKNGTGVSTRRSSTGSRGRHW